MNYSFLLLLVRFIFNLKWGFRSFVHNRLWAVEIKTKIVPVIVLILILFSLLLFFWCFFFSLSNLLLLPSISVRLLFFPALFLFSFNLNSFFFSCQNPFRVIVNESQKPTLAGQKVNRSKGLNEVAYTHTVQMKSKGSKLDLILFRLLSFFSLLCFIMK